MTPKAAPVRIWILCLLLPIAGEVVRGDTPTPAPAAVGESLLRFPDVKIDGPGTRQPQGFWTGVGAGRGTFRFDTDEANRVICTMTSDDTAGPARLQYGTACIPPAIERFWGRTVSFTVDVRGHITQLPGDASQGAILQIQVNAAPGAGGKSFGVGPASVREGGKIQHRARVGPIDWTPLRVTIRVPQNTVRIDMLMYLMNSNGTVEWRDPRITVVDDATPIDEPLPEAFMTAAEARAKEADRARAAYEKIMGELDAQLKIPSPDALYALPGDLHARRPRLYVGGDVTFETLRARWDNADYARFVAPVRRQADALVAAYDTLPQTQNVDVEDPLRGWADAVAVLSVAAALTSDEAERQKWFTATVRWIEKLRSYGITPRNLPASQLQLALAITYDWHYERLSVPQRELIAEFMLQLAASTHDFGNPHVNWIFGRQFVANHLWFNYLGRAATALTLWGEQGVDKTLLKQYLDEAAVNYWIVALTHSPEGMPPEGFLYQDYGLRPYTDFLSITEHTMGWKYDLIDKPANRTMGVRIHAMLPGARGFMINGDARTEQFSGYPFFYWVASRFDEPVAQALAEVMREKIQSQDLDADLANAIKRSDRFTDINGWRSLLHHDPAIKPADIQSLPKWFADTNMGFFTARSGWTDDAAFFGLKCGTLSGREASQRFGPKIAVAVSGHCYPEQGNFTLQVGDVNYLPNVEYSRLKLTSNHNLVVFGGQGKRAGQWVGQVGEGGAWFQGTQYARHLREAEVIRHENSPDRHYYLCDIGGLYRLEDPRAADGVTFPGYRRELTFLPKGAVVVVDHVRMKHSTTARLNLLTGGVEGKREGDRVTFSFRGGQTGQILLAGDAGGESVTIEAAKGEVLAWGRPDRYIVSAETPQEVESATFVAVIGPESIVRGMNVRRDGPRWILTAPGQPDLEIGNDAHAPARQ